MKKLLWLAFFGVLGVSICFAGPPAKTVFKKSGSTITPKKTTDSLALGDTSQTPGIIITSTGILGLEKHTSGNAAKEYSDVDATTGFTQVNLGVGSNVFESQSTVVNGTLSTYALHGNSNDTPSAAARFYYDFDGVLTEGVEYRISFDWRHVGTGDQWSSGLGAASGTIGTAMDSVVSSNTTWQTESVDITYAAASHRYLIIREDNINDNGGVYFDNLTARKIY